MINQTNVVPTQYASTPVTMPIQSAVQPNTQLLSLQPVSTPMIPAQPVATKNICHSRLWYHSNYTSSLSKYSPCSNISTNGEHCWRSTYNCY